MPRPKKSVEENVNVAETAIAEIPAVESLEEKKKRLAEKARILAEKIEEKGAVKKEEIEGEKKEEKKKEKSDHSVKDSGKTLIPLEDYVKAGCYIGTKVITPDMRKYVYRRRADGIAVINTNVIDEKIREVAKYIAQYAPENFVVVCKRETGWKAVKLFSELTGVRIFTKKYPAGVITNICLPNFFETDMIFICDPWLDKNALNDALNVKKKVVGICDTNNLSRNLDMVIPANNKSNKSLGVIFYILTREYLKIRGIDRKMPDMEEFIGEKLEDLPFKKAKEKNEKAREEEKKRDFDKIESLMKVTESEEKSE